MRYKLISCDVLYREMCAVVAQSAHQVDMQFLPKGLHDLGCRGMQGRLQDAIDETEPGRYDAILLGYGLCNNGIHNLRAKDAPLVIPRAHDCMTLFFGSRQRYLDYFQQNPGTYFQTSGWIERSEVTGELKQLSIGHLSGMDQSYDELVKKYGEDNAHYLWDTLCNTLRNYHQITFIAMGLGPEKQLEEHSRQEAAQRGWIFDKVTGDLNLIQRLVAGNWDEKDFLIVPPSHRVTARYDDQIIAAEPAKL
ncbi:MAG: DUF1638 domain-containing protein [Limisphaerales bacterium]